MLLITHAIDGAIYEDSRIWWQKQSSRSVAPGTLKWAVAGQVWNWSPAVFFWESLRCLSTSQGSQNVENHMWHRGLVSATTTTHPGLLNLAGHSPDVTPPLHLFKAATESESPFSSQTFHLLPFLTCYVAHLASCSLPEAWKDCVSLQGRQVKPHLPLPV